MTLPSDTSHQAIKGVVLSQIEQEHLKSIRVEDRIQSERYLRDHSKELNLLVSHIVRSVIQHQPTDIPTFIANLCARSDLRDNITMHMGESAQIEHKKPLGVIIAGAPASGKGTQCEFIVKQTGIVHISTGDLLRVAVSQNTELGQKAKAFMDAGQLVPDDMVVSLVMHRMNEQDVRERGWLLDGFPRTIVQAEALKKAGLVPNRFIILDVPDEIAIDRITGRRLDPVTQKTYHVRYNPPPPEIEHRVIQRSDDTVQKLKMRLSEFHRNIDQVVKFYDPSIIHRVNGTLSKEQVFSQIGECLS